MTTRYPSGPFAAVLEDAATRHNVDAAAILGPRRHAPLVEARADVARRLRDAGWSFPKIGRALNRHHTTIMHLVNDRPTGAEMRDLQTTLNYIANRIDAELDDAIGRADEAETENDDLGTADTLRAAAEATGYVDGLRAARTIVLEATTRTR